MPTRVRTATAADAEAVARVHTSSWRVAYRGLVPDAYLDGLRWQDRHGWWIRELASASTARGSTLVATVDEGPVAGFVSFGPARDADAPPGAVEVYALYVLPEVWGHGAGTALLSAALAAVPAAAPGPLVWVLAANARARRLYERADLVEDGTTKVADIGGVGLDAVRYCRRPPGQITAVAGL